MISDKQGARLKRKSFQDQVRNKFDELLLEEPLAFYRQHVLIGISLVTLYNFYYGKRIVHYKTLCQIEKYIEKRMKKLQEFSQ